MSTVATSVKIPSELKTRIEKLAQKSGQTTHAFVLSALEEFVARSELAEQFLQDAIAADERMQRSGLGYDAQEVHAYITTKAQGKRVRRPRVKRWRK
ncbi:MAG TPA: ribbon-helix-helix protein, CopG family [Burkholderiales bacterium]|nr:ribbon-helix-helix protein, CopG family [Burkholderiales bacterium]